MRKIGILTACRTNNNGTDLQCLAMQQLFSRYGNAEIINYKCEKLERSHKLIFNFSIEQILRIPYRLYLNISHGNFRRCYFNYSEKIYDKANVREIGNKYDALVVGSDQIWNLNITGKDMSFFFPWDNISADKYAYAPSLGVTDVREWESKYNLSSYLKGFKGITVRESSGVSALEKIGVEAEEMLDPLLAVEPNFWLSMNKPYKGKPYMLIYQVATEKSEAKAAIEYAQKHGLEIIRLSSFPSRPVKGVKTKSFVSLKKWLKLVQNAEMVVTDSYHGLSICVAMHTNFRLLLMPEDYQNTRSLSLLNNIGMSDFIAARNDWSIIPDWKRAEEFLTTKRKEADLYIKSICGKGE